MNSDRLHKQMDFLCEIDKLKQIGRQSYLTDGSRKENDAEHSWHLAMMCLLLQEYANESVDVLRTMSMVLIHDIVEVDAGDTYAYDEVASLTKRERELQAAERIFSILPEDQAMWMRELWDEFEEGESAEARFAHTLDNVQPMMLNNESGGKAWREHQVHQSQIMKRQRVTPKGSQKLWQYAEDNYIIPNLHAGNIIED